MSEARIGRVLVASLHQAIADLLPTRLEFYENWLNVAGLREGTIGLAPLTAVLSFLRAEGHAYSLITQRAGEYAAAWTFENVPAFERRIVRDNADVVRQGRYGCELTIDDARASDGQRRLVDAAEPSRAASGKDGRRDNHDRPYHGQRPRPRSDVEILTRLHRAKATNE